MGKLTEQLAKLRIPGRPRKFLAVDFDSRQIRIVQAQHTGGATRVLKLTEVSMPPGTDINDPAAVGNFLGQTLKDLHLAGSGVLMSVPRGQAVLKPLALPPGASGEELANMVRFQVEKELSYSVSEAVIDYTTTTHFDIDGSQEGTPAAVNVLAAVVRRPVVDHHRSIAQIAGVKLLRLGLRPYAIMRCAQACTIRQDNEAVAVVFLTADETEINVLLGNSLTFTRSAVVSIPPPKGGSDPAVKETVDALVTEITRSLQSYQTVHGGDKIDAVLLAGGTGVESRVAQELAKRMEVQCQTFDPSGALGLRETSPGTSAFIAAIGLAIGHRGPDLPFDFLAPKKPRVRRDMRKVRIYGGVGLAALALLSTVLLVGSYLAGKQQEVRRLEQSYEKLNKQAKEAKALSRYVQSVEEWQEGGRRWLDHWAYLSSLLPSCESVYIDRFQTSLADGSVTFTVKATNSSWIDKLSADLAKAGYVFRRGTDATADVTKEEYRHKTEMKIIIPKDMKVDLASVEVKPRPPDDVSLEEFHPGKNIPATGDNGSQAMAGTGPVGPGVDGGYRGSAATPHTPGAAPRTPAAAGTQGLTPKEQEWRKEWERRMEGFWERDLARRKKEHKGPATDALIAQWRQEFSTRMESFWPRELSRRRGGEDSRSGGYDRPKGSGGSGKRPSDRGKGGR